MVKRKYKRINSQYYKDKDILNIIKDRYSISVSLNERYKDYYAENIKPRRGISLIKYEYPLNNKSK